MNTRLNDLEFETCVISFLLISFRRLYEINEYIEKKMMALNYNKLFKF